MDIYTGLCSIYYLAQAMSSFFLDLSKGTWYLKACLYPYTIHPIQDITQNPCLHMHTHKDTGAFIERHIADIIVKNSSTL